MQFVAYWRNDRNSFFFFFLPSKFRSFVFSRYRARLCGDFLRRSSCAAAAGAAATTSSPDRLWSRTDDDPHRSSTIDRSSSSSESVGDIILCDSFILFKFPAEIKSPIGGRWGRRRDHVDRPSLENVVCTQKCKNKLPIGASIPPKSFAASHSPGGWKMSKHLRNSAYCLNIISFKIPRGFFFLFFQLTDPMA